MENPVNITLYECAADVKAVLDAYFDDETERQDTIEAVIGQFENKAQSVAAYYLNMAAQGDLLEAHIKAMQAKLQTVREREARLKDYLATNMKAAGILKIEADNGSFTAKLVKNPPCVDIWDESQIPDDMMRQKITFEPNKTAIKAAIQEGRDIPGAKLEQAESLRIK